MAKKKFDHIEFAVKASKSQSRQRPRSTVIEDEVNKSERRQQRRLSEKRLIEDELELEQEIQEEMDDFYR